MRHVKKLFVLFVALALAVLTYFVFIGGKDEVLALFEIAKTQYLTWDFALPVLDIAMHMGYCVLCGLVILLPLVGLIVSLVRIGKRNKKTFVDFLSLLAFAVPFIYLSTILVFFKFDVKLLEDLIVLIAWAVLGVFLVAYEIFALCEIRTIKVVEAKEEAKEEKSTVEEPKEEEVVVPEEPKVEEVPVGEEATEEIPTEEVVEDGLLGKTYTVVDGDNVLKLMVVGVNGKETKPVFEKVEEVPVVEEAQIEEVVESNEEVEEGEEESETGEKAKSLSYIERLAASENDLRNAYSTIKNQLLKHRKVHARVSKSCETFRVGYDEVAKIVVAGKGLKLYLALDPFSVDSAIYHQRDASSKKRFVEVPLVVKVKSPLSIKKACQLIDITCEKKEILPKSRYEEIDYSVIEVVQ